MDGAQIDVSIQGLPELVAKLQDRGVLGGALRKGFTRSAFLVESKARGEAPVFRARLRASITNEVDPAEIPTYATVGTNVEYARDVHDGRPPGALPPLVPGEGLHLWATRKGLDPFSIHDHIEQNGTKPNPFLTRAFDACQDQVQGFFGEAIAEAVDQWRV